MMPNLAFKYVTLILISLLWPYAVILFGMSASDLLGASDYSHIVLIVLHASFYTSIKYFYSSIIKNWMFALYSTLVCLLNYFLYSVDAYYVELVVQICSPIIGLLVFFIAGQRLIFLLLPLLFIIAIEYFDDGPSMVSKTICRYMKGEMRVLVNTLDEHKINYQLDQDGTCIHIQGDLSTINNVTSDALLKIERIKPPVGLSQSWGSQNEVIAKKLNDNNIDFSRRYYNGVEFLSWDLRDRNKVEALLGFSEWEKDQLRLARENSKKE